MTNLLRQTAYALILAAGITGSFAWSLGCATNPRHQMAVASQTIGNSLFAAQDAETAAYLVRACATPEQTNCITPEAHRAFNERLAAALTMGRAFNQAVRTWDHTQPLPVELEKFKAALLTLTAGLATGFPEDVRTQLLSTITAVYDAILSILTASM